MASDLTLSSFSDRELMHMLNDLADNEGWVHLNAMVSRVGLTLDVDGQEYINKVHRGLGVRFGWIKRLTDGVERHEKLTGTWRLTERGHEVLDARLPSELAARLDGMDQLRTIDALNLLGRRYLTAGATTANLMRREWAYSTHAARRR